MFKTMDCDKTGDNSLQILAGVSKNERDFRNDYIMWYRGVLDSQAKFLTWSGGDRLKSYNYSGIVGDSNEFEKMSIESAAQLEQVASDVVAIMHGKFNEAGQLGIEITEAENTNL